MEKIAHRAGAAHAPENTLAAIRNAHAAGAKWIEIDVQLTADHHLVVIHDWTVERTTDGQGKVADLSFSDIRALDAGGWYSSEYSAERVPSLDEVLELVKECGLSINVEIKSEPGSDSTLIVQKTLDAIVSSGISYDRILVSSFSSSCITNVREQDSRIPIGYVMDTLSDAALAEAKLLKCVSIHVHHQSVTQDLVRKIHTAGFKVLSYTINDTQLAKKLEGMGVDGVFSDRLDL